MVGAKTNTRNICAEINNYQLKQRERRRAMRVYRYIRTLLHELRALGLFMREVGTMQTPTFLLASDNKRYVDPYSSLADETRNIRHIPVRQLGLRTTNGAFTVHVKVVKT